MIIFPDRWLASGKLTVCELTNGPFSWFTYQKWWFSIANCEFTKWYRQWTYEGFHGESPIAGWFFEWKIPNKHGLEMVVPPWKWTPKNLLRIILTYNYQMMFFFGFSMDMLLLPTIIWNRMVVYINNSSVIFLMGYGLLIFPWWKSMCVDDLGSYTT